MGLSAFITMSTEGKGLFTHLNIRERQLAILTPVALSLLEGSLTFAIRRKTDK